ncbi:hypothetical protein ACQ4LE_009345 [Meloidogyne hapla]
MGCLNKKKNEIFKKLTTRLLNRYVQNKRKNWRKTCKNIKKNVKNHLKKQQKMAKMEDEIIYLNTSSNESSKALVQYDPNLFLMQNNQIFGGSGYPVMDFNVFGNALVKNVRNMDMSLMQNNQFFGEIGHISKEEMDFFEQIILKNMDLFNILLNPIRQKLDDLIFVVAHVLCPLIAGLITRVTNLATRMENVEERLARLEATNVEERLARLEALEAGRASTSPYLADDQGGDAPVV